MAKEKDHKSGAAQNKRRLHPIRFLKEVWAELKKVTWPSRKDLISYTAAVFVFVILLSAVVGVLDFAFQNVFLLIIQ